MAHDAALSRGADFQWLTQFGTSPSVKQRLLNLAREQGKSFDIMLVCFALERLLLRLSQSHYRERFILKGGMLVVQLRSRIPSNFTETAVLQREIFSGGVPISAD